MNGVSHRVSISKEEKQAKEVAAMQAGGKSRVTDVLKAKWIRWVDDRVNDQLSWELKSLDLAMG